MRANPFAIRAVHSHLSSALEPRSRWRQVLAIIGLAVVYYVASKLSMRLGRTPQEAALFWPPVGLAVAVLLTQGYRMWPGVALGVFLTSWAAKMSWESALLLSVGDTLEALLGVWCYRRVLVRFGDATGPFGEILAIVAGGVVAPLPGACFGVPALIHAYGHGWSQWTLLFGRWWLGDSIGAIAVLSTCVGFGSKLAHGAVWSARRMVSLGALLALVIALGSFVFYAEGGAYLLFGLFPLILLGGVWFGERGAQGVALTIILSGLVAMHRGGGVLYGGSHVELRLLMLGVYLVGVAVAAKVVALLMRQQTWRLAGRTLLVGWLLGGVLFSYLQRDEEQIASLRFDRLIDDTEKSITDRLDRYVEALTGGAALLASVPSADRGQWNAFADALRLRERYPGIRGIGVIYVVPPEQVETFARSQPLVGGKPFQIHGVDGRPAGGAHQQARFVISYISPLLPNLPAVGLDLASEPHRRRAAELSRDTGRPIMTGDIALVQDGNNRSGFLLVLPVYRVGQPIGTVAERRAALHCWVYAPFVTEEFFAGVLDRLPHRPSVSIFEPKEGGRGKLLYGRDVASDQAAMNPRHTTALLLAGRIFSMHWVLRMDDADLLLTGPVWAGAACVVVALLATALIVSLVDTTARANRLVERRTSEIKQMNERLQVQFEELSRAQSDLVRLRKVHEFVLESVGDGIYAIDLAGKFIMQNEQSAKLLGWSSAELVGQLAHALVHHHRGNNEPYPLSECPIHATITDGKLRRVADDVFWRRDGTSFPVEYAAAPLLDEKGSIMGTTVTFKDVTERRRLEEGRAAMLEQERELSDMKSRFISVTSHEFRTPLQVVESAVHLLEHHRDKMSPEKLQRLYARIRGSVQRMTGLLEDILILNRLDAQRNKVSPVRVEIVGYVRDLIEEHRMTDGQGHIFELLTEERATEIVVDTKLFYHVVSNLLSNAVRYSPGGTTITTGLRLDGPHLTLEVTDQGIGIPPSEQQRVFEPFERGTNVGSVEGTGLGLNIVKRVTELLGGSVSLQSEVGRGSCFTIKLSLGSPDATPVKASAETST